MQANRWRMPVIATALVAGTAGSLVTTAGMAGQAGRQAAAAARQVGFAHMLRAVVTRHAAAAPSPAFNPEAKRGLREPRMTRVMLRADAAKQAEARRFLRTAQPPVAKDLAGTQRAQIRNYFCGPATVTEMLAQMHVVLHQLAAAKELGTTTAGTDWFNSQGFPVPRVLNAHQKNTTYVAVTLPWSPTAAQVRVFKTDLVRDLNRGRGVPLAGAAYEVPGGPHLVGHPPGSNIRHWFDIRGYSRSGAITDYEDSVHGASSIGWAASVPAYSSLPTTTIVYILGARGYIW
jgi:hypothetical protein